MGFLFIFITHSASLVECFAFFFGGDESVYGSQDLGWDFRVFGWIPQSLINSEIIVRFDLLSLRIEI